MIVRFIENPDKTVTVQGRKAGQKWSPHRPPIRTVNATPGWRDRLREWAKKQGHRVAEAGAGT